MTLTQLLCDLAAAVGILSLTDSLPVALRVLVSVALALLVLILIHGRIHGQTLFDSLLVYIRSFFVKKHTIWHSNESESDEPAIQSTWTHLDSLARGVAGSSAAGRYWVVLECEGPGVEYLPVQEQIKTFARFETFLCGLQFRVQFLS